MPKKKADTFLGSMRNAILTPLTNYRKIRNLTRKGNEKENVFWALKDLSFDVKEGEVLAIIGRNGAGKSTLLKILSRITEPTNGEIKIHGRIAALLEVGTGFHPELTGRENIYMNGTILGMSKKEINRKFDEIVDFSGVEKFIDTPVKFFSSGMKVRLGFAVAAHLEQEILIVDEVLAVGDAEFQTKCLGKMEDVSKNQGRTVLYVSHNMASVQNLCTRALLLSNGSIAKNGEVNEIINSYLSDFFSATDQNLNERTDRQGNAVLKFQDVWFENIDGKKIETLFSGMAALLVIEVSNTTQNVVSGVNIAVGIDDSYSKRLTVLNNDLTNQKIQFEPFQKLLIKIKVDPWPLQADIYYFTLFSSVKGEIADWISNAGKFVVENGDYFKTGKVVPSGQGCILINHEFIYQEA